MKPKRLPKIATIQTQFEHDFRNACIYMPAPTKRAVIQKQSGNISISPQKVHFSYFMERYIIPNKFNLRLILQFTR